MKRPRTLLATLALATIMITQAQHYTIEYQWLNVPCSTNIHCDEGCSACALPQSSSGLFFGTNMGWVGVNVCPVPVTTGDNALYTNPWPAVPGNSHFGMLSGLASIPLQVDSLIIRHRRDSDGPQRLRVSYTSNLAEPPTEIADVEVLTGFQDAVFTNLGCLPIINDMTYGAFQLRVQPYQGNGGSWHLDEVRVVGSVCSELSTGIMETFILPQGSRSDTWIDVLGRPVQGVRPAPGVYFEGGRRVVRID